MGNLDYPKLFVRNLHTRAVLASINGKMKCRFQDFCVADKRGRNEKEEMRQKEEIMIVLLCISLIVAHSA